MDTWKNIHEKEGFEYIRWTDYEMKKRGFNSQLQNKINDMIEINGKADILRWELLYKYGGFFVDADEYCIEPVTYLVEKYKAFAGYENEQVRNTGWCGNTDQYDDVLARTHPLIATGTMAFPPKHELPRLAIEWIKNNDINVDRTGKRAWRTVGPGLLTRLYHSQVWNDITILPSYLFLPIHVTGCAYNGREKIYANQEWGSSKQSYDSMNLVELPPHLKKLVKDLNKVKVKHKVKNVVVPGLEWMADIKEELLKEGPDPVKMMKLYAPIVRGTMNNMIVAINKEEYKKLKKFHQQFNFYSKKVSEFAKEFLD